MDSRSLLPSMIKPYTGLPLGPNPDPPLTGQTAMWVPMLRVRCMYQHQILPATVLAVVDSGSPYCLFRAEIADFFHIDLTKAPTGSMGGIIGGPQDVTYF